MWKVVINLRNRSFTEGVTARLPKYHHEVKHLSAGQCTGSSYTSNTGLLRREKPKLSAADICGCPTARTLHRLITTFWEVMQERVYHTPIEDMTDLRQRVMSTWSDWLPAECSSEAIDQQRKRLDVSK